MLEDKKSEVENTEPSIEKEKAADAVILLKFLKEEKDNIRTEYSSFDKANDHSQVSIEYNLVALEVIFQIMINQLKDNLKDTEMLNWISQKMVKMNMDLVEIVESIAKDNKPKSGIITKH